MSAAVGLIALGAGVAVVVWAADVLVDGLLGVGRALGIAPFVLTVALSGLETENLAAGVAANAKGLPSAAAGTFLGGVTFLALAVAGLGGLIAPMQVDLPPRFAVWTAVAPPPLLAVALDGRLSRVEGAVLIAWSVLALVGLARSGRLLLADDREERTRWPRRPPVRRARRLDRRWLAPRRGSEIDRTQPRHLPVAARQRRRGCLGRGRGGCPSRGADSPRPPRAGAGHHLGKCRALRRVQRGCHRPGQTAHAGTRTPRTSTSPSRRQALRSSPRCC